MLWNKHDWLAVAPFIYWTGARLTTNYGPLCSSMTLYSPWHNVTCRAVSTVIICMHRKIQQTDHQMTMAAGFLNASRVCTSRLRKNCGRCLCLPRPMGLPTFAARNSTVGSWRGVALEILYSLDSGETLTTVTVPLRCNVYLT